MSPSVGLFVPIATTDSAVNQSARVNYVPFVADMADTGCSSDCFFRQSVALHRPRRVAFGADSFQ